MRVREGRSQRPSPFTRRREKKSTAVERARHQVSHPPHTATPLVTDGERSCRTLTHHPHKPPRFHLEKQLSLSLGQRSRKARKCVNIVGDAQERLERLLIKRALLIHQSISSDQRSECACVYPISVERLRQKVTSAQRYFGRSERVNFMR